MLYHCIIPARASPNLRGCVSAAEFPRFEKWRPPVGDPDDLGATSAEHLIWKTLLCKGFPNPRCSWWCWKAVERDGKGIYIWSIICMYVYIYIYIYINILLAYCTEWSRTCSDLHLWISRNKSPTHERHTDFEWFWWSNVAGSAFFSLVHILQGELCAATFFAQIRLNTRLTKSWLAENRGRDAVSNFVV